MDARGPQCLTVSVKEAAEMTGFSEWSIREAMRRGELPSRTPNGCRRNRRIDREDLYAWYRSLGRCSS